MVDCRRKRNKKKTTCKNKKRKKKSQKQKQKQSQRQTVNVHIHQKAKKTSRIRARKHSAGAQNLPMMIFNASPHKTVDEHQLHNLRLDLEKARHKINELQEFAKLKYGKAIGIQASAEMMNASVGTNPDIIGVDRNELMRLQQLILQDMKERNRYINLS